MIGIIKQTIPLLIVVSGIGINEMHNIYTNLDYGFDPLLKQKIINDSKVIKTNDDIKNEIDNLKLNSSNNPLVVIIDSKEHGYKTLLVEKTNLIKNNVPFDSLFLSKFSLTNDENENTKLKIDLMKKYNVYKDFKTKEEFDKTFEDLLNNTEFNIFSSLDYLAKKFPNNHIYINMSFSSNIDKSEIDKIIFNNFIYEKNPIFSDKYQNEFNNNKEDNNKLINLIYNNPNLHISKSAGNNMNVSKNLSFLESTLQYKQIDLVKNILRDKLFELSNNDYEKYEKIRNELLKFITNATEFNEYNNNKFKNKIYEITNKILDNNELNDLIKYGISDYSINHEQLNLIEQLEYLKNNKNIDLNNQITLNKAMDIEILNNNIKIIGEKYNISSNSIKYLIDHLLKNKDESILNIEKTIFFPIENPYNNYEEINKFSKILNDIKKTKPELLFDSTYGNILNPNQYSSFYNYSPINHNFGKFDNHNGTSAASPQGQSDQIVEDSKKGLFNTPYIIEYRKEKLNYDYQNIGIKNKSINIEENNINLDR